MNDLYGLQAKKDVNGFKRWQSFSKSLSQDPRLIAYYNFTEDNYNRRTLKNASLRGDDLDGAIVGASQVQGRWGNKTALTFKRPGDRVRINIPVNFTSLTFSCWTKLTVWIASIIHFI